MVMNTVIKNILVPVDMNAGYVTVIRQAGELAKQHSATIHLLHMADINACRRANFPWLISASLFQKAVEGRSAILQTWKRWLETEYRIRVTATVEFGGRKKGVVNMAKSIGADLIILQEPAFKKKWYAFWNTPVEYIIQESPCQVITFFSEKKTIAEWKNIVIPVTDFIPETRIRTIIDIARIFRYNIHLVTVSAGDLQGHEQEYHFLTEALKRLKPSGSLQVECHVLQLSGSLISSFLKYAGSVKADILMTNMAVVDQDRRRIREMNYFNEY